MLLDCDSTIEDKMFGDVSNVWAYRGHLSHGHTYKLQKKVMGGFVLTHAPKTEQT